MAKVRKRASTMRVLYYILLFTLWSILGYFAIKNWDFWESIISIFMIFASLITAQVLNFLKPENVYEYLEQKIKQRVYKKYNFKEEDLLNIKSKIDRLNIIADESDLIF